jgi:hypothetical protein
MLEDRGPWGAWALLAAWILASCAGWAAGVAIGLLVTYLASQVPWLNEDRVLAYAMLTGLGIALGAAQAVVLRHFLPRAGRWVGATLAGYLLGLLIILGGNAARLAQEGLWDDVVLLALLGSAIGVCQWWILRGRYRHAGLWVVATVVGFLSLLWMISDPAHSMGEFLIKTTALGTLTSIVPGAVLVWLVGQPVTSTSQGTA